jgi:hypothetical protein
MEMLDAYAPGRNILPDFRHIGRHQIPLKLSLINVLLTHPFSCSKRRMTKGKEKRDHWHWLR